MTAYTLYDVTVSVLTPLHIGSGKDLLNEYDYAIRNGRTWRLNESALLDAQDVEDADTAALLGGRPPAELLQAQDFRPKSRFFPLRDRRHAPFAGPGRAVARADQGRIRPSLPARQQFQRRATHRAGLECVAPEEDGTGFQQNRQQTVSGPPNNSSGSSSAAIFNHEPPARPPGQRQRSRKYGPAPDSERQRVSTARANRARRSRWRQLPRIRSSVSHPQSRRRSLFRLGSPPAVFLMEGQALLTDLPRAVQRPQPRPSPAASWRWFKEISFCPQDHRFSTSWW